MTVQPTKKYILLVDDEEEIIAVIIRKILFEYSDRYSSLVATDGYEALEYMKKHEVALVVLDIRMPNLDGIGVCRKAMADPKMQAIPILVTSGFISGADKELLRSLGVHHFLDKPYKIDLLFEKIGEILSQLR